MKQTSTIAPLTYESIRACLEANLLIGQHLPLSGVNQDGDTVIINEGENEGLHFYQTQTVQKNGWIRINSYYADGSIDETYEHWQKGGRDSWDSVGKLG